MPNPLKTDPTRTGTLRRSFSSAMNKRLQILRGAVLDLVVVEDAFGLGNPNRLIGNTRFAFETDAGKVDAFRAWFQEQVDAGILEVDVTTGDPWTAEFVTSAYRKGMVRGFTDSSRVAEQGKLDFFGGSREEFLTSAFASPEAVQKIQLINTRAFTQLKGITDAMSQQISRELTEGLSAGRGPREIARKMNKTVRNLTKQRALTLARTEVVYAHAEGQLDSFERLGVETVGVMAEWITAGDDRVCPLCLALDGVVLTVKEARGILPRHPNCRCAWIPFVRGDKKKGKKTSRSQITKAIKTSLQRERPKASLKEAKSRSTWLGADKKIGKR